MPKPRKSQSRRDAVQAVSPSAYARKRGFSRAAICKAIAAGRIPFLKGKRGRKLLDPRAVDKALRDNTDLSKLRGRQAKRSGRAAGGAKTYNESRARREHALAQLAELELAERNGELVSKAEHNEAAFKTARQVRDEILTIPKWATQLVGKTLAEMHVILTAESRKLCEGIVVEVREAEDLPVPRRADPPPAKPAAAPPTPPAPPAP